MASNEPEYLAPGVGHYYGTVRRCFWQPWLLVMSFFGFMGMASSIGEQKEIDPYAFNAALSAPGVNYETTHNPDGSVTFNVDPEFFPTMPHDSVVSLAESGMVSAQLYLGRECARSTRQEDVVAAVKWFNLGAKQGDPACANGLAMLMLHGQGGLQQDVKRAVELLKYAGEKGYENAYLNLAHAFLFGDGVERDPKQALEIYHFLADNGSIEAMRCLAANHFYGQSGKKNYVTAYYWFRKAVKHGALQAEGAGAFVWVVDIVLILVTSILAGVLLWLGSRIRKILQRQAQLQV